MFKQFGGKITREDIEKYSSSKHWDGKKFVNLANTTMDFNIRNVPELLYKQIFDTKGKIPKNPLPIQPFQHEKFINTTDRAKMIWYGHSVVLIHVNNKTILIDPMLGPDASPIAPFTTKRFSENTLDIIDELPDIDLMLLTHDHYDHLDLRSMEKLAPKIKQYYVAMGTARHLIKWGIDANKIEEFDWWDNNIFNEINITFTPTRHFSGRGATDRAKSLWGGWTFKTNQENIYFSGDGGYGLHFKEIGERLGPFDFGFMECGQYNEPWHQIHMYPEEAVQAAFDVGAKLITPVHWAGFALAPHKWKEPITRFVAEAELKNINYITPELGELFIVDPQQTSTPWWEQHE